MRIGELAGLAGVTPRTVRHYHHVGVLPEPARQPNGYREYTVRDAVLLLRATRLGELGLSLEEVADVLADDGGRDLTEILQELDRDLVRQEQAIRATRQRIELLLSGLSTGALSVDAVTAPAVAALFTRLSEAGAHGPALRLDQELMSMLPERDARRWAEACSEVLADDAAAARLADAYARFDALATGDPDDPDVAALAREVIALVPESLRDELVAPTGDLGENPLGAAILDELSPAQAAVAREIVRLLESR